MDEALHGMDKLYILGTDPQLTAKFSTQVTANLMVKKSKPRRHSSGNENHSLSRLSGEPGQIKRRKRRIRLSMQKRRRRSTPVPASGDTVTRELAEFAEPEIPLEVSTDVLDNPISKMDCDFEISTVDNNLNIQPPSNNPSLSTFKSSSIHIPITDFLKAGINPPTAVISDKLSCHHVSAISS